MSESVLVEVLFTNNQRGIYWGLLETVLDARGRPVMPTAQSVVFESIRHCFGYSTSSEEEYEKGYISLMNVGPQEGSRIGPKSPPMLCHEINKIGAIRPEAIEAFAWQGWGVRLKERLP